MAETQTILRDKLAVDRTKLANQRTFLAYVRTTLILFATGATCIKLFPGKEYLYLGLTLMVGSLIILAYGIKNYYLVQNDINNSYYKK